MRGLVLIDRIRWLILRTSWIMSKASSSNCTWKVCWHSIKVFRRLISMEAVVRLIDELLASFLNPVVSLTTLEADLVTVPLSRNDTILSLWGMSRLFYDWIDLRFVWTTFHRWIFEKTESRIRCRLFPKGKRWVSVFSTSTVSSCGEIFYHSTMSIEL